MEKRVIQALYGKERGDLEETLMYRDMLKEMKDLKKPEQILAINLKGQHPDNVFTNLPYDKGSLFLKTLEKAYGTDVFDAFVRKYFADFSWQTITTEQFESYLYTNLVDRYPGKLSHSKIKEWIYKPGYPADGFVPTSAILKNIDGQIAQLKSGSITAQQVDTQNWTVDHWNYLLDALPVDMPKTVLDDLDAQFGLSNSTNLIKTFHWLQFSLQAKYQPAIDKRLGKYLLEQGRIKLTKPLYQEMVKTPEGVAMARTLFAQTKDSLHAIVVWEIQNNVFKKAGISLK